MDNIRILIVDDAIVVRRLLSGLLDSDPQLQVVGTAVNGRDALVRLPRLKPDVLILDIEMPEMDGLETLKVVQHEYPTLPVIMFSTLTTRGAVSTLEALALGAKDYVAKPEGMGNAKEALESVRANLIPKIKSLVQPAPAAVEPVPSPGEPAVTPRPALPASRRSSLEAVVVGASTGGPNALAAVLAGLPGGFPLPILVVQHMPPIFTRMLAERLNGQLPLQVREAVMGAAVEPGQVWIAPGDFHLSLKRAGGQVSLVTHQEPPENSCRPAADVLFRSAAGIYGGRVLAVLLTGMGQDGLQGCTCIRQAGGQVVVQDQASSVVWGMPGYVAKAGLADRILPLDRIAGEILARTTTGPGRLAGQSGMAEPATPSPRWTGGGR